VTPMPESRGEPLPLKEILDEVRKMIRFFGIEPPSTAEVFGPASYFEIIAASAPDGMSLDETAHDGWPFYLVVPRGRFVRRGWGPGAEPRAIATVLWSPTEYGPQLSLRHDLPVAMSQLGAPHVISLDD